MSLPKTHRHWQANAADCLHELLWIVDGLLHEDLLRLLLLLLLLLLLRVQYCIRRYYLLLYLLHHLAL